MFDPRINQAPETLNPAKELPAGFMDFFLPLHRKFTPWQQKLVRRREEVLEDSLTGKLPNYLPASPATTGDWRISLPEWVSDQRNQMTGPADEAELVVKMLNSGAPGVMLDLEDSLANTWANLTLGIKNIIQALYGDLCFFDEKRVRQVCIPNSKTVVYSRPRGLHLSQAGVIKNELTSASLFDTAMIAFQVDAARLKHPLSFYIPKTEAADEALWWKELFEDLAAFRGWSKDYIKAMALVESFPMAYQFEEFIFHLRDHLLGLNLGRWDYMASLIHFNLADPQWVLPDRNTIPHDVPFFQLVRTLLPDVCHRRGILAIGGMTALYPSRQDPELNDRALKTLAVDKKNEATCGMDGAWTGHPDQNEIAIAQFPFPNQLARIDGVERFPNLRVAPVGVGRRTLDGTRAAVRTTILYRFGVLSGKGASLINGYMEDLATDRIYRLIIAQRVRHRDAVEIVDETGRAVKHTPALVTRLYDEELAKLLAALPAGANEALRERYRRARQFAEQMIVAGQFNPV